PALHGRIRADVAIVGAGFTGLWTAIRLAESEPGLRIVVLEQAFVGFGASGRNGGFCEASLTHGRANGELHFPTEVDRLERLGRDNLRELIAFIHDHRIECDLEETGVLAVADQAHQVDEFREWVDEANARGDPLVFLDRKAVQAEVHSPIWQAGVLAGPGDNVVLDPAKLCRGLARVATELGIEIYEGTRTVGLERHPRAVRVRTVDWSAEREEPFGLGRRLGLPFEPTALGHALAGSTDDRPADGEVEAAHVVVATSAYSGWYPRLAGLFVPVYDYVLVSDPLTATQHEAIGWAGRQAMADANNQFHYFRLTADDRILWGGYDAVYHPGNGVGPRYDDRPETFARLEAQFFRAFPQLAGLGFPYRWGGAIDTTSTFVVTFGQSMGGRVTHALGYTGLGVGASRWAAGVVRDLILRPDSELLELEFVRSTPFPFPPEPIRAVAVNLVRRELDRADRNEGRRGLLLRALDAVGIGYDS
ncbi:MAG: FAD-binding oxidoreductase, partial [Chloroflexota bacterium]|nr:FAD-binding oxidoreductase [Chloroflexota bacterium]